MPDSFTVDESGVSYPRQVEVGVVYTYRADAIKRTPIGLTARVSLLDEHGLPMVFDTLLLENLRARGDFAREAHARLGPNQKKIYLEKQIRMDVDDFCGNVWPLWVGRSRAEETKGDLMMPPPKYVLPPYVVEGAGTIAFGPPERGKSYICLAMAISIDAGCDYLWQCEPKKVMFLNLERSKDSIKRRLTKVNMALGLPPERPLLVMNARGKKLGDLIEAIREDVREKNVGVIILDSLSRVGMGSLTEDMPANEAMDALNQMVGTWLAIGHTSRADSTHVFGSQMFDAAADVILQVKTQRVGDQKLGIGLQMTKANDIPRAPFRKLALCFDQYGLSEMREAGENEFPELVPPQALNVAGEIFDYLLEAGKATPTQIARDTGHGRAVISKVLRGSQFVNLGKTGQFTFYGVRQAERPAGEPVRGPQQQELV